MTRVSGTDYSRMRLTKWIFCTRVLCHGYRAARWENTFVVQGFWSQEQGAWCLGTETGTLGASHGRTLVWCLKSRGPHYPQQECAPHMWHVHGVYIYAVHVSSSMSDDLDYFERVLFNPLQHQSPYTLVGDMRGLIPRDVRESQTLEDLERLQDANPLRRLWWQETQVPGRLTRFVVYYETLCWSAPHAAIVKAIHDDAQHRVDVGSVKRRVRQWVRHGRDLMIHYVDVDDDILKTMHMRDEDPVRKATGAHVLLAGTFTGDSVSYAYTSRKESHHVPHATSGARGDPSFRTLHTQSTTCTDDETEWRRWPNLVSNRFRHGFHVHKDKKSVHQSVPMSLKKVMRAHGSCKTWQWKRSRFTGGNEQSWDAWQEAQRTIFLKNRSTDTFRVNDAFDWHLDMVHGDKETMTNSAALGSKIHDRLMMYAFGDVSTPDDDDTHVTWTSTACCPLMFHGNTTGDTVTYRLPKSEHARLLTTPIFGFDFDDAPRWFEQFHRQILESYGKVLATEYPVYNPFMTYPRGKKIHTEHMPRQRVYATRVDAVMRNTRKKTVTLLEYKTLSGYKWGQTSQVERIASLIAKDLLQAITNAFFFMCNTLIVPTHVCVVYIERQRRCVHCCQLPFTRVNSDQATYAQTMCDILVEFMHRGLTGGVYADDRVLVPWSTLKAKTPWVLRQRRGFGRLRLFDTFLRLLRKHLEGSASLEVPRHVAPATAQGGVFHNLAQVVLWNDVGVYQVDGEVRDTVRQETAVSSILLTKDDLFEDEDYTTLSPVMYNWLQKQTVHLGSRAYVVQRIYEDLKMPHVDLWAETHAPMTHIPLYQVQFTPKLMTRIVDVGHPFTSPHESIVMDTEKRRRRQAIYRLALLFKHEALWDARKTPHFLRPCEASTYIHVTSSDGVVTCRVTLQPLAFVNDTVRTFMEDHKTADTSQGKVRMDGGVWSVSMSSINILYTDDWSRVCKAGLIHHCLGGRDDDQIHMIHAEDYDVWNFVLTRPVYEAFYNKKTRQLPKTFRLVDLVLTHLGWTRDNEETHNRRAARLLKEHNEGWLWSNDAGTISRSMSLDTFRTQAVHRNGQGKRIQNKMYNVAIYYAGMHTYTAGQLHVPRDPTTFMQSTAVDGLSSTDKILPLKAFLFSLQAQGKASPWLAHGHGYLYTLEKDTCPDPEDPTEPPSSLFRVNMFPSSNCMARRTTTHEPIDAATPRKAIHAAIVLATQRILDDDDVQQVAHYMDPETGLRTFDARVNTWAGNPNGSAPYIYDADEPKRTHKEITLYRSLNRVLNRHIMAQHKNHFKDRYTLDDDEHRAAAKEAVTCFPHNSSRTMWREDVLDDALHMLDDLRKALTTHLVTYAPDTNASSTSEEEGEDDGYDGWDALFATMKI